MNGADAVAKCLELQGVKTVYGYPGVAICPVYDSILKTDIHTVLVRSEANAAHAASGMARISGEPGVCICTSGPGATNLITGIATAYADSIPLVCITGQVNSDLIGGDVFQEADITGAAESFVKYSYLVRKVSDIPRIFREAFHIASTGRRGPVLIDIPADIQAQEVRKFVWPEEVALRTYKPTFRGNPMQIRKVVKALEECHKPILYTGGGVHLCGAADLVRQFSEKHQIPVVSTMMGIGTMPSRHELYMGMAGNNGNLAANLAIKDADLVILVGARLADRAVNQPEKMLAGKVLVHIDVDPAEIGKNAKCDLPIVGDAKAIFEDLILEEIQMNDMSEWTGRLREVRQKKSRRVTPEQFTDPAYFVNTLSTAMDENSVYVADVGQNQIWSCANVVMRSGRFLTSGGMGTMGYALPAAIGAKMADRNRQVVSVSGDGGFQMAMMELATMNQEGVDLKIVVLNNSALGMVREYQHFSCENRFTMVDLRGGPDYEQLAKAYGIGYLNISSNEEVEETIKTFLSSKGSVLLEVIVDEDGVVRKAGGLK
ncbi:MAG: biosynthetic-type acetolactate synthase large subunit [Solobacterium sp.]|nr:biosynthetic-type acetolactate synthase large subunit [Solobacterium sp.]